MLARVALTAARAVTRPAMACPAQVAGFHTSTVARGFEEFYDPEVADQLNIATGRAWTAPELRRKSFDDLHKLWFVLYKERNVLITLQNTRKRATEPFSAGEERRYRNVKRSMAAIKVVLDERKKIDAMIAEQKKEETA